MKKSLLALSLLFAIAVVVALLLLARGPEKYDTIRISNYPKWGDSFGMIFTKFDSPINDRELKRFEKEGAWAHAYLANRDFRTITYDELVANSTEGCLRDRQVETREKFERRLTLISEHFKNNQETPQPINFILWKVGLDIKKQRYLLVCTIDKDHINEKDIDVVLRFRRLTLLKFEEKWKFAGSSLLHSEGLAAFPWNDDSKIRQIINQKCAKFENQVIEPCNSSTSPK